MKYAALILALLLVAVPVHAQIGGIKRGLGRAADAKDKVDQIASLQFSEEEERKLGEHISGLLVNRFGIYQDPDVARYVSLVGAVVAQGSTRPDLKWQFLVLDTDGVNAYAAPGGLVHITKGALGLIRTEAELAGVLGHEIVHITAKHTIRAIQKANVTGLGAGLAVEHVAGSGLAGAALERLSQAGYSILFENQFDRDDEMESDQVGMRLASTAGYSPRGMIGFLHKITERNKDAVEPNGLFASHPQTKDRISAMEKTIRQEKLTSTATVEARYTSTVTFEALPATAISMDIAGVRGAVGDDKGGDDKGGDDKGDEPKKAEPRRGGLGLIGASRLTKGSQAQNTQTVASAGSRGVSPDRDAVGGGNRTPILVTITAADLAEFKKGIA